MPTTLEYLDLIPSENRDKPKFIETLTLDLSPLIRMQTLFASLVPLFDLDIAVGNQLDIIGQWVGFSRNVSIPIPAYYFTWDGAAEYGWDFGIWQGENPGTITVLPDDIYRTFIRAKIAANQWDGTTTGAYAIWNSVFPNTSILIQDNQNMTYDLAILGGTIDSVTLALITGGYLPLKPEGVRVNAYYIPDGGNAAFAWDIETDLLKGWDDGSWVKVYSGT